METINFRSFIQGNWREQPATKAFSFIPLPTASMFLNEPVFVLLGIGALIVAGAIAEKQFIKHGKEEEAEFISMVFGMGLPTVAIGGAIYVVLRAGQMFL